jgi:hypothetical protein
MISDYLKFLFHNNFDNLKLEFNQRNYASLLLKSTNNLLNGRRHIHRKDSYINIHQISAILNKYFHNFLYFKKTIH